MPSHLLTSMMVVAVIGMPDAVSAQLVSRSRSPVAQEASALAGRFQGIVEDERGAAIGGVSVLAAGTTLAIAMTDSQGRFSVALPSGDYLIRATRAGYLSTYREMVSVGPNSRLERRIRLTRADRALDRAAEVQPDPAPSTSVSQQNPSEVAWRLRHLSRTVLREVSPVDVPSQTEPAFVARPLSAGSLLEWAMHESTRAAGSFLTETDFSGQLNLFTTSSVTAATRPTPSGWSRGIADVLVGAPIGALGDWSVRGAMAPGEAASWTVIGEYQARADQRHALRLGVWYSSQDLVTAQELPTSVVTPADARTAGGFRVADRWNLLPRLEVGYGLRFDRYDYLAEENLFSPRFGLRARVVDRTFIVASTSQRMFAPGADQFMMPSETGLWLPPVHTFSSLSSGHPELYPQRVRQEVAGFERELTNDGRSAVSVEWFSQSSTNQLATLFGMDEASDVGHYYLATAGDVEITGWRVRLHGVLYGHLRGSVEDTAGDADWRNTRMAGALRRRAPALVRSGTDQVSDVRTSIDLAVPRSATLITFDYRLDTARHADQSVSPEALVRGRFNVELRQRLPYQPLDTGVLNLVFTVRTLFHDDESSAMFDELLTVHPPTRLTGGLQVRF